VTTLAEIRTRIIEAGSFSTNDDTTIDLMINQACADWRMDTQIEVDTLTLTLTAGQSDYPFTDFAANGIVSIKHLSALNGSNNQSIVDVVSYDQLDDNDYLSGTNTGVPNKLVVLSATRFKVIPTPSTDDIVIAGYGVAFPDTLTLDADEPSELLAHHQYIFYRAMQLMLEWDRQPYEDISVWEKRYLDGVAVARRMKNRMMGSNTTTLRPSRGYRVSRGQGLAVRRLMGEI